MLNRKEMTKANILNTIIFKEIEVFVLTIIILLTMIDELSIKSSLKEIFVQKIFINFKFFIIKLIVRKSFKINIKKSVKTSLKARL